MNGERPPARAHARAENLRGLLLASAASAPDRPAVVGLGADGEQEIVTYGELERRVDRNAAALDRLGLDVGDRVVLESHSSADAIAMLLACATVGLAFIPVSPETPAERLMTIIGTAEPALYAQAEDGRRDGIPEPVGTARFGPGGLTVERPPVRRVRRRREVVGTDTAYIIFTSGTTGRPKGVVMSHRAIVSFFRGTYAENLLTPDDRVASTSPLQFDFALFDIGFALGSGAAVVPVPRGRLSWPRRFLTFLRDTGVTHVNGVPSIWRPVLRHEPEMLAGLDRLRGSVFSGEDFPLQELRRLQSLLPRLRVVNIYGATETMAASFTEVPNPLPEGMERLSIGFAHAGAEMTLIDERGRPVDGTGTVGEIYLRSPALFTGYWDDPEATRAAVVPDPLDPRSGKMVFRTGDLAYRGPGGEMYFCGRVDSQVQIRGNRVELGEVERRIREFPGIDAAVALVLPRPGEDPALHAFVMLKKGVPELDVKELVVFCKKTLQGYMIPHEFHVVDEFPVTVNGKIDRAALAARQAAPVPS